MQKCDNGRSIEREKLCLEDLQKDAINLLGEKNKKEKTLNYWKELENYLYALSDAIYKKEHVSKNIIPVKTQMDISKAPIKILKKSN